MKRAPPVNAGRAPPALPPRPSPEVQIAPAIEGADRAPPAVPPRRQSAPRDPPPVHAGRALPAVSSKRQSGLRDAPPVYADRTLSAVPPRRQSELRGPPPTYADRAPPPRRHTESRGAPPTYADLVAPPVVPPKPAAAVRRTTPMRADDQAQPAVPSRRQSGDRGSPSMYADRTPAAPPPKPARGAPPPVCVSRTPPPPLPPKPARLGPAVRRATSTDEGQAPSVPPRRPNPGPNTSGRTPHHREAERRSTEGVRSKHASVHDSTQSRNAAPYDHGVPKNGGGGGGGGGDHYSVSGSGGSSKRSSSEAYGADDALNDRVEKLEKKWDWVQKVDYVVNAPDHIEAMHDVADMAQGGVQAAEQGAPVGAAIVTAAADGADQAGTIDQAATTARVAAGGVDNAGGALEMTNGPAVTLEAEGTDMIVESHQHYEYIEGTCLEEPLRCAAEHCAVPVYKCLAEAFGFCYGNGVGGVNSVAGNADELTGAAGEGLGHAEGCFSQICACLDMSDLCLADEALEYALPCVGCLFSLFRVYQGSTLSCRSCLGMSRGVEEEKLGLQWMMAEGNARLWQGCCGLLGGATGMIIITLPSVLAASLVVKKARKNRLIIENKRSGSERGVVDPETGELQVITAQPFPSPEDSKRFYDQAYEAVSGRLKPDQNTPQQLLEDDLIPEKPYPQAPRGQWSSGVFDCFDHIPSCVTTVLCTCITAGQVAEGARIFKYAFYVTIAVFICGGIGIPGGLLWLFFGTYIVAVSRARVAEVYGIPLNRVENWCLSLWCNCCVATQVARHLFAWGKFDGPCAGWCECGPTPVSKWPTPVDRNSSSAHSSRSVRQASYLEPEGHTVTIVHAPAAVAPMAR